MTNNQLLRIPARWLATVFLPSFLILFTAPAAAQKPTVPASPEGWENATTFETHKGKQAVYLDDKGQGATGGNLTYVKDLTFDSGTVEYDIAFDEGTRFSSLHFRHLDPDNTEHVYLRSAFADDPGASDARKRYRYPTAERSTDWIVDQRKRGVGPAVRAPIATRDVPPGLAL